MKYADTVGWTKCWPTSVNSPVGAVNRLTDAGAALADAVALAAGLAARPARASTRIKSLCRHAHGASLEAQLEMEAQFMVEPQGDVEAAEGIGAFFAKRQADFLGVRRR